MYNCTLTRCMNRQGFKYLHLREKGVLCPDGLEKRTKFARICSRLLQRDFWKFEILSFTELVSSLSVTRPVTKLKNLSDVQSIL